MTIVFSLKRDGSLLGTPRISHAKLLGDEQAQRDFAKSILAAFGKCLPISITDGLGGALAGRPMSFRITSRPREIETRGPCSGQRREAQAPKPIDRCEKDACLGAS